MMALLIFLGITAVCAAIGYTWARAFPNPMIDHETASAHVQGLTDEEGR